METTVRSYSFYVNKNLCITEGELPDIIKAYVKHRIQNGDAWETVEEDLEQMLYDATLDEED